MDLPVNYDETPFWERKAIREQYVELQEGLCYHCNKPLDGPPSNAVDNKRITRRLFPKNFFNSPVHLHHNHTTGMTIGAVHGKCNAVLWEHFGI